MHDIKYTVLLSFLFCALISGLYFYYYTNDPEWVSFLLTFVLALATIAYAFLTFRILQQTQEQAKASKTMAQEMEKARFAAFRPILSIDEILQEIDLLTETADKRSSYSLPGWRRTIQNIGTGPALQIEWTIRFGGKVSQCWKIPVLGSGQSKTENKAEPIFLDRVDESMNTGTICVQYKDIFDNPYVSNRIVWIEGEKLKFGILQVAEAAREIKLK